MDDFVRKELEAVRRIVLSGLAGHRARVYLFGSRARGDAMRWSDVDVAVEPLEPLPRLLLGNIREALEDSNIVYKVDLVDLSRADQSLLDEVRREGVSWTR